MSGTVNIARSLFLDEAFKDQPFTEREAFMWLVMEASWKDRTKRVGLVVIDLKRGQLAASIRFMADAWGWEKSTVDRFIKRLEKRDMIGTDSGTGISVITIRKYNDYQGAPTATGTGEIEKRDRSGTPAGQTRTPEVIPEASLGEDLFAKPQPKKRKSSPLVEIPDGWVPNDINVSDAMKRGFSEREIEIEADRFCNHHRSKGSTFKCWDAAWRTWLGNATKFAGRGIPANSNSDTAARQIAIAARFARSPGVNDF
jgi:hypothetical protein